MLQVVFSLSNKTIANGNNCVKLKLFNWEKLCLHAVVLILRKTSDVQHLLVKREIGKVKLPS